MLWKEGEKKRRVKWTSAVGKKMWYVRLEKKSGDRPSPFREKHL